MKAINQGNDILIASITFFMHFQQLGQKQLHNIKASLLPRNASFLVDGVFITIQPIAQC